MADRDRGSREAQWTWVREVLLRSPASDLYPVTELQGFVWVDVPYAHAGVRTDVLFKSVPAAGPAKEDAG